MTTSVYIACGLTHVPSACFAEYSALISALSQMIESTCGWQTRFALKDSDPHLAAFTPSDRASICYLLDRRLVAEASLVIAEMSFPSTGAGMELQLAAEFGIPIVCLHSNTCHRWAEEKSYESPSGASCQLELGDRVMSIMAAGNPMMIKLIEYTDAADAIEKLSSYLAAIKQCRLID
jgi:hypothetical protein